MSFQKYPYLSDKEFLKVIDELPVTKIYSRIFLLNWKEQPLQEIQGRIIDGNITIDGNSAVRRTCNLTTYVEDTSYSYDTINSLFSLNKKVMIEVGVENLTKQYTEYPIIWFPQGYYVIMGISLNHSLTGTNISLTLKDKMVLLNGECGGTLPATVVFNEIEYNSDGTVDKPTIFQLIQEAVNHYGEIDLNKIIISDIDLEVRQVMKWTGDTPIYQTLTYKDGKHSYLYSFTYSAAAKQISYGDDVGYIYVPFTYPDELIGQAGENVCTILDKIKNTLGNYEYFFDIWGNFVFQEKKNYLNIRQTTFQLTNGLDIQDYLITNKEGINVYKFSNSKLVVSISNTPKYENIKNDFIVWGKKKGINEIELPVRYHLTIDKKPQIRQTPVNLILYTDEYDTPMARIDDGKALVEGEKRATITVNDWRTELYVQGLEADYNKNNNYSNYYIELMNEWRKIFDLEKGEYYPEVAQNPYGLDFYLDMIDEDSIIGQYSIENIGKRSQVLVDDTINCLFEPDIPDVICIETGQSTTEEEIRKCISRGQNYTLVSSNIYQNLITGGTHNSAFVAIRDLLYQYTNYNESISITMVPIYHLETNTRISLIDEESGTNGDYIITNISIPLNVGGTSSITAIKAMEKI